MNIITFIHFASISFCSQGVTVGAVSKRAVSINYGNTVPNPTIYYLWDSTIEGSIKECVSRALVEISNISCVKFVNTRGNNPPIGSGFIIFSKHIQDTHCTSVTGLFKGGPTTVELGSKCGVVLEVCLHEVMHALGFKHEHDRLDSVDHVRHNHDTKSPVKDEGVRLTPYDLSSIMHYGSTEHVRQESKIQYFTRNKILEHSMGSRIRGSQKALSFRDQLAINKLFQCAKTCEKQKIICQHGGFLLSNCTCKCTYGFSGSFCENFSFGKWFNIDGCGQVPVGDSGSGFITSPNYPSRYPRGVFCQWLIKGNHEWERIKFSLESLDLEYESMMNLNERCQDQLFIWPHGTDVTVQSLSCLPDVAASYVGHRYTTQYNWLLIEFRSNKWGQFNHTGFNISYKIIDPRPKIVHDTISNVVPGHLSGTRIIPDFDADVPSEGLDCVQCEGQECDVLAVKQFLHCPAKFACARKLDAFGRVIWRGCLESRICTKSMSQCEDFEYYGCKDCCTTHKCNSGSLIKANILYLIVYFTLKVSFFI